MNKNENVKTYREILIFAQMAAAWLKANPAKTKFAYALNRLLVQVPAIETDAQEALADIDVDHAAIDAQGVVLSEPGGAYKFTKDDLKLRNTERRAYFDREQFEISPHYVREPPATLTEFELETFAGFVIDHETVRRVQSEREDELEELEQAALAAAE